MADYSFKLPDLGEGTVESEIVAWRAGVGDAIEADQPLVDVMTDKATIEITAPVTGTLISVAGESGDVIAVGAELAVFATGGDAPHSSFPRRRESSEITGHPEGDTVSHWMPEQVRHDEVEASGEPAPVRPQTSPAIRRLARERGINLDRISGTGTNGRITRADIEACLDQAGKQAEAKTEADATGVHEIKLVGLRRKIAEQMSLSASRIPHFSYVEEVDVTDLEQLRRQLNETRQENRPELTYLPFVMQALVKVASEFPQCNAHFDDERQVITQFDSIHIGIAVQTGNGLMVPVIRHVETLDLWQCARELRQVAEKTRTGKARREELTGSTITITSLGALGGIVSTPIINHPEVAIIGINRTQQRPVFQNNGVTPRLMMNISSSFDHRVVDGHDAACAIRALKSYLESPATMFLPA
ncbi:MAG: dihydrolipoamide acetyltransferase family protein [Gammaproteobacteria bacterium]|nr:dihydrolipoamide acetyltransferase family protein [Gammaproteobacteria bacterium]